jgi:hypothetical protein
MQKNVLLPLLFFLFSFSAQAQLSAGNVMLGGSANFGMRSYPESQGNTQRETYFGFSPQVGYFLSSRVAAGFFLGYNGYRSQWQSSQHSTKRQNNQYSVGPFVRVYHMVSEKAGFFGQLSGSYHYGRHRDWEESTGWRERQTASSFGANFRPGFTYFISRKLAAELAFGNVSYSESLSEIQEQNESRTGKGFHVDLGLGTFGVSFNYFINR